MQEVGERETEKNKKKPYRELGRQGVSRASGHYEKREGEGLEGEEVAVQSNWEVDLVGADSQA